MKRLWIVLLIPLGAWAQNPAPTLKVGSTSVYVTSTSGANVVLTPVSTCPTSTCTYSIDQGVGTVIPDGSHTYTVNPTSTQTYTFSVNNANVGIFYAPMTVFVGTGTGLAVTQSTAALDGGFGCPATIAQYTVCEITFSYPGSGCSSYQPQSITCNGTITQPWDQVQIWCTFTGGTSGLVYNIGGFYEGGANATSGGNSWKVRFAPQTAEAFTGSCLFGHGGTSPNYATLTNAFTSVANPNRHGFLGLNASYSHILQYNDYNGTTAAPVSMYPMPLYMESVADLGNNSINVGALYGDFGFAPIPNYGWKSAVTGMGNYYGPYASAGYNMMDVYLTGTLIGSLGLPPPSGVGNIYLTGNVNNNNNLNTLVASITFDDVVRQFSLIGLHPECIPVQDPYVYVIGGNVFNNTTTTAEYIRYLQYSINRWSAYCDVNEVLNEQSPVAQFENTTAAWIHQQDPYGHLAATNTSGIYNGTCDGMDLCESHDYPSSYNVEPTTGLAATIASDSATAQAAIGSKPNIFGETGNGAGTPSGDPDYYEEYRNWLWVSFFNQMYPTAGQINLCNGLANPAKSICVGSQQQAQLAIFSTFANSFDPAATPLVLTSYTPAGSGQTLSCYALGSSTDLAGYCTNATNSSTVTSGTVTMTIPAASMAGEWIAPSTGAVLSTFTTSATPGSQAITYPAFSQTHQNRDIAFRIRSVSTPVMMTNTAPGCLISTSCSLTLVAKGGAGGYTYAIIGGAAPPGMTLSGATLSGTVTTAGNWNFDVQATDSSAAVSPKQHLILVVHPAIAIPQTVIGNYPLNLGVNGFDFPIVVTGGMPPIASCVVTGTIPGITFTNYCGNTGSATSSAGSPYSLSAVATDGLGNTNAPQSISAYVPGGTVEMVALTAPNATQGWSWLWQHFGGAGGSGSPTLTLASGSYPVNAGSAFGYLNGGNVVDFGLGATNISSGGTFSLTVTKGGNTSAAQSYTVTMNSFPAITTSSLAAYTANSMYYASIGNSNGTPPLWCAVTTGVLPPGFTMDSDKCEIYGVTSSSSTFSFTVTLYDAMGANVSQALTLAPSGGGITALSGGFSGVVASGLLVAH